MQRLERMTFQFQIFNGTDTKCLLLAELVFLVDV